MDAVIDCLAAGGRSGKKPDVHSGEEFGLIFDGNIILTSGDEVHELQREDAVTVQFAHDSFAGKSSETARVEIVSTRFTH